MLTATQVEEFREKGFLQAIPLLTEAEADTLRTKLFEVMEGRSEAKPDANRNLLGENSERVVIQIVNIWQADPQFLAHAKNPAICEAISELMGTDTVRVWHDQVQYKPPKVGGPTNWHQDHPYWPVVQPADMISAWVALDDADIENGCMWMVPHSHKWGAHKGGTIGTDPTDFTPTPDLSLLPEGAKVELVPCPVKKGQVMFHHCLTWHGSPPNNSERGRPAIAVHYMPGHTRYVKEPGKSHLIEQHIEVESGEILEGSHFPLVWQKER